MWVRRTWTASLAVTSAVAFAVASAVGPTAAVAVSRPAAAGSSAVSPAATTSAAVAEPAYQWPEAHQNPQLTGVSPDPAISQSTAPTLGLKWMTYTGGELLGSPVVAWNPTLEATLVYVGNDVGDLTAVDQSNGLPVWSVQLGSAIRSIPLVENGYLWVVPTASGRVYKLNAATGATVCSAPITNASGETADASPVFATPPGGQPTVYVAENDIGSSNGPVVAVNEANCGVDFSTTPEPVAGTGGTWDFLSYGESATGEGLVVFGTADPDSAVYAIDAVTGAEVWRFASYNPGSGIYDVGAGAAISPPGQNGFADGVAYIPSKYGFMYALDLTTGALIWKYQFGSGAGALDTPALSGTDLVFGDASGTMWDLDAVNGTLRWKTPLGGYHGFDGAPAIVGPSGSQVVVDADLAGQISVFSLTDGSLLYSFATGSFSVGSPAEVDANLIETAGNGFLYDFTPDGTAAAAPTTAVSSPAPGSSVQAAGGLVSVAGQASASSGVTGVAVYVQRGGAGGTWWDSARGSWTASPYPNPASLSDPSSQQSSWTFSFPSGAAGGQFEVLASAQSGGVADSSLAGSQASSSQSSFSVRPSPGAPILAAPFPWAGPAGEVTVHGSGFDPGESVVLSIDGTSLATVTAGPKGAVPSTHVRLPANTPFGPAEIDATGQSSGFVGTAPIYVTNGFTQAGGGPGHAGMDSNDEVLNRHLSLSPATFLNPDWSYSTGAPLSGSAVVADGFAYVANQAGTVTEIRMTTGLPVWSVQVPGAPEVTSTPALTSTSLLLVASSNGELSAFHQFSGALAWQASLGGALGSPAVSGGVAYVGSDDGNLSAVSVATGHLLWSEPVGAPLVGSPAVDGPLGLVAAASSTGAVAVFHASSGASAWSTSLGSPVTSGPVLAGSGLYLGTQAGGVYSLAVKTGATTWVAQVGSEVSAISAEGSQILAGAADGSILYLKESSGAVVYRIALGQPVVGIAGATNFSCSLGSGGQVLGSKPTSTDPKAWLTTQGTSLVAAPVVVNGEVLVAGGDGTLVVYTVPGVSAY
jgi:outer membrane protein assembly factor BamB